MKGINVYRRPQIIKLSTFLDFYEADPSSNYKICVQNGYLKTNIQQYQSQYTSQHSYQTPQSQISFNAQEIDRMAKKTVGLFANLIKNIETNKHNENTYQTQYVVPVKPQYQYFQDLENDSDENSVKPFDVRSTKKVKERATGFIHVNLKKNQNKQVSKSKENKNEMNGKNNFTCNEHPNNGNQTCIDINFSFEQISNQFEERKKRYNKELQLNKEKQDLKNVPEVDQEFKQKQLKNLQNIFSHQNLQSPAQFVQKKLSLKQIMNPIGQIINSNFVFQNPAKKETFQPITFRNRHQNRIKQEFKVDLLNPKLNEKTELLVEGAKKTQSRLQNKCDDSSDLHIDFDLEINF